MSEPNSTNGHHNQSEKVAVVLFNMGGPDSMDTIEPFLFNLFRDEDIIQLPLGKLYQRPLAKLISSKRAPKVGEDYKEIGGKSPIQDITWDQANALEKKLNADGEDRFRCFVAMRYWRPFTEEALQAIKAQGIKRVILLSLYPHYSRATTLSSLKEWKREQERMKMDLDLDIICSYPTHPKFVGWMAEQVKANIEIAAKEVSRDKLTVLFSAHGLPQAYVRQGDPYRTQIEATVEAVMQDIDQDYMLAFQSQVGPVKWEEPSTPDAMKMLREKGREGLVVVPVAFVSEHIETLAEIDMEFGDEAKEMGYKVFQRVPTPNDDAAFIECLEDLVRQRLDSNKCGMMCGAPDGACCGENHGVQGAWDIDLWLRYRQQHNRPEMTNAKANRTAQRVITGNGHDSLDQLSIPEAAKETASK